MFQSEARRLKIRSEAMYHGLVARQKELVKQVAALETGPSPLGGDGWKAAQHLRALARVMIEETSDWKILYQTHLIRAG